MATFECRKCGNKVSHSNLEEYWKMTDWCCPACWLVIAEKRYKQNIKGGLTIFAAVGGNKDGTALGDRTVFEVVKRMYIHDNPDEEIIFLDVNDNHKDIVLSKRPDKFFLNEFCRVDTDFDYPKIRFHAMTEILYYERLGIYPQLEYKPQKPDISIPDNCVVLHLRNIEKNPKRNVSSEYANDIVNCLYDFGYNILLIGNDNKGLLSKESLEKVIDARYKLTLPETAWVCERSEFFVGRDSGLMHVAAAAGAHIVTWELHRDVWAPKTNKLCFILDEKETSIENILNMIKEMSNYVRRN